MKEPKPNQLIDECSPYLLQHAYNPVDWNPWNEEVFRKALREDKPIFLSIGYSTCHWCHVMEKESFEDLEISELLNRYFISIKVDREERPDIDHIYMMACQMMTGSGGWPLSIFMTPKREPFFAGTYFPKTSGFGRIGFKDLLINIHNAWMEKRDDILKSSFQISEHLKRVYEQENSVQLDEQILREVVEQFHSRYDSVHGGFGTAPKFPSAHNLLFLLRYAKTYSNNSASEMALSTLKKMRMGGIFDQIGFGFHRYSTDREWLVPHFEKMLYDQAMLIHAYLEAFRLSGGTEFLNTAESIAEYVLRDLSDSKGGFHSAEDADSEGIEGEFYMWTEDELKRILSEVEFLFVKRAYNISSTGNYKDEFTKKPSGKNILHLIESEDIIASSMQMSLIEFTTNITLIRRKLFNEREKRTRPLKDDKVLTDWNGLMISALARLFIASQNSKYLSIAGNAYRFIQENMIHEGRLVHRYRNNTAGLTATIDDYAFFIWGSIELYEATFNEKYLAKASELTQTVIDDFWDAEFGGFFFTPNYGEELIVRTKEIYDGAIPCGNSVMAMNLFRLSRLTVNYTFENCANKILETFSSSIQKAPLGSTFLLSTLIGKFSPTYDLIIVGDPESKPTKKVIDFIQENYLFNISTFIKRNENPGFVSMNNYTMINDLTTFYICKDYRCELPTNNYEDVIRFISENI